MDTTKIKIAKDQPGNDHIFFQINSLDIGCLWHDKLGITCEGLSPFGGAWQPPKGHSSASEMSVLDALALDPAVQSAATILGNPDIRLECFMGGASSKDGYLAFFRNRKADPQGVAAIVPSFNQSYMIHYFGDFQESMRWVSTILSHRPPFISWEAAEVALKLEAKHELPDRMPLETVLYLLHLLDCYRRVTYQNLLLYRTVDVGLTVFAEEFNSTMIQSLRSGDVRWLLPAFLRITPGLRDLDIQPTAEHLDLLQQHKVLVAGRQKDGQPIYGFGEAGLRLAIEFYRTWHTAAGLSVTQEDGLCVMNSFLAATAFANHLLVLEPERKEGGGIVCYAALSEEQLAGRLCEFLNMEKQKTEPQDVFCAKCSHAIMPDLKFCPSCGTAAPSPSKQRKGSSTVTDTCSSCGNPLNPESKYCGKCGATAAKSATCPGCGKPLKPGIKFCSSCGFKVQS